MKKIYIAGKITGLDNYKENFKRGCDYATSQGYIAINPSELPEGMTPMDYMQVCISMVVICDEVWLLPNWTTSSGAKIEKAFAEYAGKLVRILDWDELN